MSRTSTSTREITVYIAMNRFKVQRGREEAFEENWRERESHLDDVAGFREFHLLRGPSNGEITLFVSHSQWDSKEAFKAWTQSEAFQKAHGRTNSTKSMIAEHPHFEGFEAVI